jgi:HNH endonuclease
MEWFSSCIDGYSVTKCGRIKKSCGKELFGSDKDGYIRVYVDKKLIRLHRIIAQTFLPNQDFCAEVNHKDGNKKNNHVDNLEWCDRKKNMQHASRTGLHKLASGEKSIRAILTQNQVDFIRANYIPRHPEFGQSALGRKLGVTNSCIWRVVHGDNW